MTRIQHRRGTAAEWVTANPVLASGEPGYETNTGLSKKGNGSDPWNDLDYEASGGGGGGGTLLTDDGTGLFIIDGEGEGGGGDGGGTTTVVESRIVDFGYCQSELAHGSYTGFENETKVRQVLQGIKDTGATRVRAAGFWSIIEPVDEGGYVWTGLDRFLSLCKEYGLKPLLCITSPAATGVSIADYGQLCGAVAARYGPSGTGGRANLLTDFEIWNEINHRSFATPFNVGAQFGPVTYVSLLQAAVPAIRAANPDAFIVSVGLMSTVDYAANDISPSTYLQGIYDNNGAGLFDAVGFHWYSGAPDFSGWQEPSTSQTFYLQLLACRAIMVAAGDSEMQIWVTEMGFNKSGNVIDPNVRAEWLLEQIELLVDLPWVGPFFLYQYKDSAASLPANQAFGAVDFNLVKQQPLWDAITNINAVSPRVPDNSLTLDKFIDGEITGAKLDVSGTGGSGKFLAYAGDGSLTAATPAGGGGGGGGNVGYVALLPAIAAGETYTVTHGLDEWNVLAPVVSRSFLKAGALTGATPNQVVGINNWSKVSRDAITITPDVAIAANEFVIAVNSAPASYDTTGPTAGTLTSPGQGYTSVDLVLTGGTDAGVGNAAVYWYRNGTKIGESAGNTFTDDAAFGTYNYTAKRVDLFGNLGTISNTLSASTVTLGPVAPIGSVYQNRDASDGTASVNPTYAPGSLRIAVAKVSVSHAAWVQASNYDTLQVVGTNAGGVATGAWTKLPISSTNVGSTLGQSSGSVHLFYKLSPPIAASGETVEVTFADSAITPVNAIISVRQYEMVDQTTPFGTPVVQNANSSTSITVPSQADDYTVFAAGYYNTTPTGYNRNLIGSVQGGVTAGYCHYLVDGEYPGAAPSIAHTIPTSALHVAFGVPLRRQT